MDIWRDETMTACLMDRWQYNDDSMYEHRRPRWWRIYTYLLYNDPLVCDRGQLKDYATFYGIYAKL